MNAQLLYELLESVGLAPFWHPLENGDCPAFSSEAPMIATADAFSEAETIQQRRALAIAFADHKSIVKHSYTIVYFPNSVRRYT